MYRNVVDHNLVYIIGDYGIVKVKEETVWDNGKVSNKKTVYDVCLDCGDGDIVASFDKLNNARKWARSN